MKEPSPHGSRLAIAGGLAAAIIVGGGGFLLGRATVEPEPATIEEAPAPVPSPAPSPSPAPPAVLGRADILSLVTTATDTMASGREPLGRTGAVDGKRFELRLPFGCSGPSDETSSLPMRWRYDEAAGALRFHVAPTSWTAADWDIRTASTDGIRIEGFWIERPWILTEGCPAGPAGPLAPDARPVTLPGQTLAIGQVFAPGSTRAGQRNGKPYKAVIRMAPDALDVSQGFRLRVSGRLTLLPGGQSIRCRQPAGAEQRPICLVGVVMDEVAIENPAKGDTLATWHVAHQAPKD